MTTSPPPPAANSPAREQSIREYDAWKAALKPLPPRCGYCGAKARPGHRTCTAHRDLPETTP